MSKAVFIDTSYIYALINKNDQWHRTATKWQLDFAGEPIKFITSEFVLMEIADGLSAVVFRNAAALSIRLMQQSLDTIIVPASSELLLRALDLYENRPDKDWGLTDCTSFITMQDRGITDVLSTDGHFKQAGFNQLLDSQINS